MVGDIRFLNICLLQRHINDDWFPPPHVPDRLTNQLARAVSWLIWGSFYYSMINGYNEIILNFGINIHMSGGYRLLTPLVVAGAPYYPAVTNIFQCLFVMCMSHCSFISEELGRLKNGQGERHGSASFLHQPFPKTCRLSLGAVRYKRDESLTLRIDPHPKRDRRSLP